jgi:hypothetical protein
MKAPLFLADVLSAAACAPLPPGESPLTAQFPEFRVDPNCTF